jgi:hypothetical protein
MGQSILEAPEERKRGIAVDIEKLLQSAVNIEKLFQSFRGAAKDQKRG